MTDILAKQGTVLQIKNSGGDAAITLASLANGAARQSAKLDLGANFSARYAAFLDCEFAVAPTPGERVELWLGWSWTATAGDDNPGGLSGTDAAYKATEEDEWKKQLDFAGSLIATADASGIVQRQNVGVVEPKGRYVSALVVNKSGQAFHTTEANLRIVLVPITDTTV
jgi:hypothetical protein